MKIEEIRKTAEAWGVDVRKDRTKQDIIHDIQRAENRASFTLLSTVMLIISAILDTQELSFYFSSMSAKSLNLFRY